MSTSNTNNDELIKIDHTTEMAAPMEATRVSDENIESPPNNLVEKNFQSVLKPLLIMETLFVCTKYKIRDNLISVNSISYRTVSVFFMLTLMCFAYYCWFDCSSPFKYEGFQYIRRMNAVHIYILLVATSFLNCFTNIIQRSTNVLLVIKLQNIFKTLNTNESFKRFAISNWISVITLNSAQIGWVFYSYYIFDFYSGFNIATYFWILTDINIVYVIMILKLMTKASESCVRYIQETVNLENESYWNTIYQVQIEILDAYKLLEGTFQHLILFFTVHTTSRSLSNIAICIEMKKSTNATEASSIYAVLSFMSLSWIVKNMFLLTMLTIECEKFYSAMREVNNACIELANSRGCSVAQKRVCKNIQRVQKAFFKKMKACGMFTIDAAMPISLFALITTYTIVIIQFEIL